MAKRAVKDRLVKRQPVTQGEVKTVWSDERIEQELEKLHSLALEGSVPASNLFLKYTTSKPVHSTGSQAFQTWKEAVEAILNDDDSQTSAG